MSLKNPPHIPSHEPLPKRRKVDVVHPSPVLTTAHHAEIHPDGTMTPVHDIPQPMSPDSDAMETSLSPSDCPCGYLHGPGEQHYHDISAVGLSSSMMRGPD